MKELTLDELSYIMGFLHTDGSLYETTRNRGRVYIELKSSDLDILEKIQKLLGGIITFRSRVTNFGSITTATLSVYLLETRNFLKRHGMIAGKKSDIVYMPDHLSITDYLRGVIDGNGSIGFNGNGTPYLSVVVCSEQLKNQILEFLDSYLDIRKNINRNKRDNVYNIMVTNENAVKFAELLYKDKKLYMNRKYNQYLKISEWVRTKKVGNRCEGVHRLKKTPISSNLINQEI